jgi:TonB family protein
MTALVLTALMAVQLPAPPAGSQTIRAKDGDVILVENDDKVRVVRRRHANVRIIHNAEQRWVLVLADWLSGSSGGDGRVDYSFDFREMTGDWPLGARWEGATFLDQYDLAGSAPNQGIGITTSAGLIQLLSSFPAGRTLTTDRTFAEAAAVAVLTFRGSGGSMTSRDSFDVAEQRALERMNPQGAGNSVTSGGFRTSIGMSVDVAPGAAGYPAPTQPVRVGGNIRTPQKIKHADPVMPEVARQAGARGMVIVEIIIAADGTVQQAKVLRSIPLLDQAAIDAVKQWVYEPTHLNGSPVPVIMTVTVNFQ